MEVRLAAWVVQQAERLTFGSVLAASSPGAQFKCAGYRWPPAVEAVTVLTQSVYGPCRFIGRSQKSINQHHAKLAISLHGKYSKIALQSPRFSCGTLPPTAIEMLFLFQCRLSKPHEAECVDNFLNGAWQTISSGSRTLMTATPAIRYFGSSASRPFPSAIKESGAMSPR